LINEPWSARNVPPFSQAGKDAKIIGTPSNAVSDAQRVNFCLADQRAGAAANLRERPRTLPVGTGETISQCATRFLKSPRRFSHSPKSQWQALEVKNASPHWNKSPLSSVFCLRMIPRGSNQTEATMPVILWLLGVPLVVVVALMLTHVI
jgi:hypothetical protein